MDISKVRPRSNKIIFDYVAELVTFVLFFLRRVWIRFGKAVNVHIVICVEVLPPYLGVFQRTLFLLWQQVGRQLRTLLLQQFCLAET